jgi:NADH:ubiquinone oxidoreductase subunit 2 (subunit N)
MSKITIASAAIADGITYYAAILLLWTLLSAVYFYRILKNAYFQEGTLSSTIREAPVRVLIPIFIISIATILLGFFVESPMALIRPAAALLLGGGF